MTAHKHSLGAVPAVPEHSHGDFEFGNQTVLGRTDEGVVYDDKQLSEAEAREAVAGVPVVTEDEPVVVPAPVEPQESVRERVGKALRQKNVSPKILADLLVSVVSFIILLVTGVPVSVELAAGLAKAAGFAAGWLIGPGEVVVDENALKPVEGGGAGDHREPLAAGRGTPTL